jgi:hypothetical protein
MAMTRRRRAVEDCRGNRRRNVGRAGSGLHHLPLCRAQPKSRDRRRPGGVRHHLARLRPCGAGVGLRVPRRVHRLDAASPGALAPLPGTAARGLGAARAPFMMVLLVLFGGALAGGLLAPLTWGAAAVGLLCLLVVRPLAGLVALAGSKLRFEERSAISFFGIRGGRLDLLSGLRLQHRSVRRARSRVRNGWLRGFRLDSASRRHGSPAHELAGPQVANGICCSRLMRGNHARRVPRAFRSGASSALSAAPCRPRSACGRAKLPAACALSIIGRTGHEPHRRHRSLASAGREARPRAA